jgi:hypothetical protein
MKGQFMKYLKMIIIISLIIGSTIANSQPLTGDYLGQTPPGSTPTVFAPGIVSVQGRYEYGLAVSPDGNEIFFTAEDPGSGLMAIRRTDDVWGSPEVANLRQNNSWELEAFYTVDGQKVYFSSDISGTMTLRIFCAERTSTGWQKAYQLDSPVNSVNVFWATVASNGTMYYTKVDARQIWRSKLVDGKYATPENLKLPFGVHPFISPDESFLLFNGKGDIYVAFHKDDDSWTEPQNLGNKINSSATETCPSLSPDGKYIFFSRYNEPGNKSNIYWVSSAIIDTLKSAITGVKAKETLLPNNFELNQNFPNPFSGSGSGTPTTTIQYSLTKSSQVKLIIYNMLGEKIKTLVDFFQTVGEQSLIWNGSDDYGKPVSCGVYFYRLEVNELVLQKKMILIQ